MIRSDNDRLEDILRAARRVAEVVACGRDAFDKDWTLRDAAAHQVEIIVDAFTRLTPEYLLRFPDIPIKDMSGMRVILAHKYWATDYTTVWDTLTDDIPRLAEAAGREYTPPEQGATVYDENVAIPRVIPIPPEADQPASDFQ